MEEDEYIEIYQTVADLQKDEFIRFLRSNAVVPFRLIEAALRWAEIESQRKIIPIGML